MKQLAKNKAKRRRDIMPKRPRGGEDDGSDGEGPSTRPRGNPGGGPSIGMQTSSIKNKQVRGELYSKLKHKQKVSAAVKYSMLKQSRSMDHGTCMNACIR